MTPSTITVAAFEEDVELPLEPEVENEAPAERSAIERLFDLGRRWRVVRDQDDDLYALVPKSDASLPVAIRSGDFEATLAKAYRDEIGKEAQTPHLQEASRQLARYAQTDGERATLYRRSAFIDGAVFLDLGNERGEVVRVTEVGWDIVTGANAPLFRRSALSGPLPIPEPGGTLADLRKLVSVKELAELMLLVGFMTFSMRARGPFVILVLTGAPGATKSTAARIVKALIDPSRASNRGIPKREEDVTVALLREHVVSFDNISHLSASLSDFFCRVSTGGTESRRILHTTADEATYNINRPLILNGIDQFAIRGDLAERTLTIELESLPKGTRKTDQQMDAALVEARPKILGFLMDVVAAGLAAWPSATVDDPPRMADFARWLAAIAPALGTTGEQLVDAYRECLSSTVADTYEADVVAQAIVTFMRRHGGPVWTGTALDLLHELGTNYGFASVTGFPSRANALAGRIKRAQRALAQEGVHVRYLPRTQHRRAFELSMDPQRRANDPQRTATVTTVMPSSSAPSVPQIPPVPAPSDDAHDGDDSDDDGVGSTKVYARWTQ